jgi:hypothetical protein
MYDDGIGPMAHAHRSDSDRGDVRAGELPRPPVGTVQRQAVVVQVYSDAEEA